MWLWDVNEGKVSSNKHGRDLMSWKRRHREFNRKPDGSRMLLQWNALSDTLRRSKTFVIQSNVNSGVFWLNMVIMRVSVLVATKNGTKPYIVTHLIIFSKIECTKISVCQYKKDKKVIRKGLRTEICCNFALNF